MAFALLTIALTCMQLIAAQVIDQSLIQTEGTRSNNCEIVCRSLAQRFGEKVYHQILPTGFRSTYFSQQQREVVPACVVFPTSSEDVSHVLQIVKPHDCPFAVKSGGHGIFAGASNANGGVTIDLRELSRLQVSEDRLTTSVGTGRKWGDVYRELEPMNLVVAGGRDTQIGVGGFILGGGISFVARRYGWGIDNVRNFETVLANGTISNVNYESHPDLYFALRGAATQFGVVTRFELNTYSQGPIWGGHSFYLLEDIPQRRGSMGIQQTFHWKPGLLIERAITSLTRLACRLGRCSSVGKLLEQLQEFSNTSDPIGQIILSFAFVPYNLNTWVACLSRLYGEPEANPAVFKGFESLDSTSFYTTNRITRLSSVNAEVDWMNAEGYRQSWSSATFKIDLPFMSKLLDFYIAEIDALKSVQGLLPSLIMQIITREEIAAFQRNGGNAFGISDRDGPLLLINNAIRWNRKEDDRIVDAAANKFLGKAVTLAKEMHVHHPFIYQNYANHTQDVFAGYGVENKKRLMQLRKIYDPDGLFQRLQPGYFRL